MVMLKLHYSQSYNKKIKTLDSMLKVVEIHTNELDFIKKNHTTRELYEKALLLFSIKIVSMYEEIIKGK